MYNKYTVLIMSILKKFFMNPSRSFSSFAVCFVFGLGFAIFSSSAFSATYECITIVDDSVNVNSSGWYYLGCDGEPWVIYEPEQVADLEQVLIDLNTLDADLAWEMGSYLIVFMIMGFSLGVTVRMFSKT